MEQKTEKRPFSDTQEFIQRAYEEAYGGEIELPARDIDVSQPYSVKDGVYRQAAFVTQTLKNGLEVPFLMNSLSKKPKDGVPVSERRGNAALLYLFPDEKDPEQQLSGQKQIGKAYGVTGEVIRADVVHYLNALHQAASDYLQRLYPLKELRVGRPRTVSQRISNSLSHDFTSLDIAKAVESGKSAPELFQMFGANRVIASRKVLKSWGMKAPERIVKDYKPIVARLRDPDTPIDELRILIKEFNNRIVVSNYHSSKEGGIFVSLAEIQHLAWGNRSSKLSKKAFEILQENGIPVHEYQSGERKVNGKVHPSIHRFSLVRMIEEAVDALQNHPDGSDLWSVKQVGGGKLPPDTMPTTYDLKKKRGWQKVSTSSMATLTPTLRKRFGQILLEQVTNKGFEFPVVVARLSRNHLGLYVQPEDVDSINDWMEQFINELRQHSQ